MEGLNWAPFAIVNLQIDDPATPQNPDYNRNPGADGAGNFQDSPNMQGFNLAPGQIITVKDMMMTTRVHVISPLRVTQVDFTADRVSSVAGPGEVVTLCVPAYSCLPRTVTAGQDGSWVVGYNPEESGQNEAPFDIRQGDEIRASVSGVDEGLTIYDYHLPPAYLNAFPLENQVHSYNWQQGDVVTLNIDDPNLPGPLDYTQTRVAEPAPWNPNEFWAPFNLDASFTLHPGQSITISANGILRHHVITGLAVTAIDVDNDIVSGFGAPNMPVQVGHICDPNGCHLRRVTAGEDGRWTADFSVPGDDGDEQSIADIIPGVSSRADQCDEDGDCTALNWRVPRPYIEASVNGNWIHGRDWPAGTPLELTIADGSGTPLYQASTVSNPPPWNPNETYAEFINLGTALAPGQQITVSGGSFTRTLTISSLSLTAWDVEADTLSGSASPHARVQVCANFPDGCVNRNVTADSAGLWTANYQVPGPDPNDALTLDLRPSGNGWAAEYEPDGDLTWLDWRIPNPSLSATPQWNQIDANEWPLGDLLTLTIDDPATAENPDYTTTATVEPSPWRPNDTYAGFQPPAPYSIRPGLVITLTNGRITQTHTVTALAVTNVDSNLDTVSGRATPGAEVSVGWLCTPNSCAFRRVTADDSGAWTANFAVPGEDGDEKDILDIAPGIGHEARECDAAGNCTRAPWQAYNPFIEASLDGWYVRSRQWPNGAEVTMTITGGGESYTATTTSGPAPWNPSDPFDTLGEFDLQDWQLQPGQVITMTGAGYSKTMTVSPLAVTGFDVAQDRISGTAGPGNTVQVCVQVPGTCINRYPTAGADGAWSADFTAAGATPNDPQTHDLRPDDNGWAAEREADGDQTWANWHVPNPSLSASHKYEDISAWDWPVGALLTLTIDDPGTQPTPDFTTTGTVRPAEWDPSQGVWNFSLNGLIDLQPGFEIVLTDGATTKTHTVTNLLVTGVDTDTDTVSGTAEPGTSVRLWSCYPGGCANRTVPVNDSGAWSADFAHPGSGSDEQQTLDIAPGIGGEAAQVDEDSDQTRERWEIHQPRLEASYEYDWISISGFTIGGQVTYTIYDAPGGNALFGPITGPVDPAGNGWLDGHTHRTDLIPGYMVEAVDEASGMVRQMQIRRLIFERLDPETDTAYGLAEPGAVVQVHVEPVGSGNIYAEVTAGDDGRWFADLGTMGHDVQDYWWANTNLCDENGNCLTAEAPRISGSVRNDHFGINNFSKNADITLSVYDAPGGAQLLGPLTLRTNRNGHAWVNLGQFGFDLQNGHYVVVTDSLGWSKDLLLRPVTFDKLDPDADTAWGTAELNGHLSLHVTGSFSNWHDNPPVTQQGTWFSNFRSRGYDITGDMWGSIWLHDNSGDISEDFTTPQPTIHVSPQQDYISGNNFSPNGLVMLQVYDTPGGALLYEGTVYADGGTNLWLSLWQHQQDLMPGMLVAATDVITGQSTSLILAHLTFDMVDIENDLTTGQADSAARVVVQAGGYFDNQEIVVTAADGEWRADFGARDYDLTLETWANAQIYDLEGDSTVADGPRPPQITASLDKNWINGSNWAPDAALTIEVYESQGGAAIGEPVSVTTDNQGNFFYEAWRQSIDLVPGQFIVVTETASGRAKQLLLADLDITAVDFAQDNATGTAPADARLTVGFGGNNAYLEFDLFPGAEGAWLADFAAHDFDLTMDMGGSARIFDEDGDATQAEYELPTLTAFPQADYVEGWGWENGAQVTLTVDDPATAESPDYTASAQAGPAEWDPNTFGPTFHAEGLIDIRPGFILTLSDGVVTKELVVAPLMVTAIDPESDTISGTATPGARINTWVWGGPGCETRHVLAGDDGAWSADFGRPGDDWDENCTYDLTLTSGGDARQEDEDRDATGWWWWQETNQPPTAEAGPDQTVLEGQVVNLDGSASSDPEEQELSFAWDLNGDGAYDDALTPTAQITFADEGVFTAALQVTDAYGASAVDQVTLTVGNANPVITAISGPVDPLPQGSTVSASARFFDPGTADTHTAVWDWGDGATSTGAITGGTVTGSHAYLTAGVYTVTLTVTDDDGGQAAAEFQYVVIYNPNGGHITGGGWIISPAGAYLPDPNLGGKANFGFVAKYHKGASVPTGNTNFILHGAGFTFKSESLNWLVVSGEQAQYKGIGTINGEGQYGFILTVIDGDLDGMKADRFRIQIWDAVTGAIIYDNQLGGGGTAAPTTALEGGSITIHKAK